MVSSHFIWKRKFCDNEVKSRSTLDVNERLCGGNVKCQDCIVERVMNVFCEVTLCLGFKTSLHATPLISNWVWFAWKWTRSASAWLSFALLAVSFPEPTCLLVSESWRWPKDTWALGMRLRYLLHRSDFKGTVCSCSLSDRTLLFFFQIEISPLQNAVETVESKNKELDRIITNLSSDTTQSINPLSMILNGIIDAAVMGGIAKYEEVWTHLIFLL